MLLLLQPVWAAAQLAGHVRSGGRPVPGATVTLRKATVAADSAGAFSVPAPPAGTHRLLVTAAGYEPEIRLVNVADTTVPLVIELQAAVSTLDAVVISGTLKAVSKKESPIPVEVYSQQFFKKNPVPSVFEALSLVSGVRPQINCNVCNTGDIHINGLEGPYTMVTIDGMPIVSSLASVYGLFGLPAQLIERVEVVKGPASSLYGSEAVGGLINVITKSPQKAPLFSANVMSTSWREHLVDLGLKWKAGKAQSLLGVHYFNYTHPVDDNGDNFTDVTLQHRVSVFNKWTWQRPANRTASLAGRYFFEDRWGGEMQWTKRDRGGDAVYGESIYTHRWEVIGNYQLPLRQPVHFWFSATGHKQDSWYGNTPYAGDQKILFGQLTWDKTKGAHSFLLGLAARYNRYDDNTTATFDTLRQANRPDRVLLPGLFAQNEWAPHPRHRFLVGVRLDHHPVHKAVFTPRVAYKWSADERQTVRLNTGTGFRVVNLFTEEHAALTGARSVEVKEDLKPERSYNLNLNYTRRLGPRSRAALLDLSVWYSRFQNRILPDYTTDANKIIYGNLAGHAVSKGVTANAEFNFWQRLKGNAGLTVQEVSTVSTAGGKTVRQQQVLTESWSGTWGVSYSFPLAGLTLDYTGTVYGPMQLPLASALDPRQPQSPVWSLQNLQVTKWISPKLEVYAGVKNLLNWTPARGNPFLIARAHDPFDRELDYNGDGKTDVDANGQVLVTAQNPYGLTFDPTYVFAPNQGRRVFAGVRLTIK